MAWLKREKEGILTRTDEKVGLPEGVWDKCPTCKSAITVKELQENDFVCTCEHNHHFRIGSKEYFRIIFDSKKYQELFTNLKPRDSLQFTDRKPYHERLKETSKKTNLDEAIKVARGKVHKVDTVIAAMDFSYIGGSMGSVVGEKVARAIDTCIEHQLPLVIISKSGGARMMESTYSLMQMAKTSSKLALLEQAGLPYISVLTDPTTGGVTASFAMLGDINIAEPNALIGFAGPRVIKQTTGKELPEGFQSSEFLEENGFVDFISDRRNLKKNLGTILKQLLENQYGPKKKQNGSAKYKTTANGAADQVATNKNGQSNGHI
jgi:acetyl-CoA carboxylase carboxyl transferase subunit beta